MGLFRTEEQKTEAKLLQGPRHHPLGVHLGTAYRDTITEKVGKATAVAEYLYGCVSVQLTYTDGDGNIQASWFDKPQLELIGDPKASPLPQAGVPG